MTSGWKHMRSSTSQGAATASRARVDRPALPRLELGPGAGVVAQVAGEVAQQPAEVAAAHLAGDPEPLDHAVADRVGQPFLEQVEGVLEPPGDLVVAGEGAERLPQRLRAPLAETTHRLPQRHPGPDRAGQVVHGVRPHLGELPLTAAGPADDARRTGR